MADLVYQPGFVLTHHGILLIKSGGAALALVMNHVIQEELPVGHVRLLVGLEQRLVVMVVTIGL
jgi:hypothetical protein